MRIGAVRRLHPIRQLDVLVFSCFNVSAGLGASTTGLGSAGDVYPVETILPFVFREPSNVHRLVLRFHSTPVWIPVLPLELPVLPHAASRCEDNRYS